MGDSLAYLDNLLIMINYLTCVTSGTTHGQLHCQAETKQLL